MEITSEGYNKLFEHMESLLDTYKTQYGISPAGFIIGPEQFLLVELYRQESMKWLSPKFNESPFKNDFKFLGYPVYIKITDGVELLVHPNDVFRFIK